MILCDSLWLCKKKDPWYLLEVASPFADKERIDWQIPAWKRHPRWSKHVKTHRVHCLKKQPDSNLFIATTRVFVPKRPATSGSPLQLTLSLGWSLAITTMVYKSLAGANRTMLRRTEGKSSIYRWFLHYKSTICVQNQSHTNHFFGWPSRQGLEWHSREHSWRREHQAHCTGRPRGKCYWSGASDSNEFGLKIRHLSWLKLVNAQNNLCDSHLSYGWCLTTYINQPIWYTYMCYARVC